MPKYAEICAWADVHAGDEVLLKGQLVTVMLVRELEEWAERRIAIQSRDSAQLHFMRRDNLTAVTRHG